MRLERRQAFGIAAVLAIIVAGLVYYLLSQSTASRPAEESQTVPVVVATTNIPPYTNVTMGMVDVKQVPVATAPGNAITQKAQVVGRLTQYAISNGQLLVRGDVVDASAAQGLTFVIPKGRRAVTVALDPISGVGGFVYPGDHVDILATFEREDVSSTRIILQNTEVLAMNEQTVRPKTTKADTDSGSGTEEEAPAVEQVKSTTLAVTPQEAQRLILAAYDGSIHMILRAREDTSGEYEIATTTDWELMGMAGPMSPKSPDDDARKPPQQNPDGWPQGYYPPPPAAATAPPAAAPAAPAAPTVEVIRGREHSTVTTDG